ncbi:MAG: transposase [Armatimonadota bacterium]
MFCHKDEKWNKDRRCFAARKRNNSLKKVQGKQLTLFQMSEDAADYRFSVYITNYDEDVLSLWRKCRSRADDENRIKELKEDFGLEGFSMKKFYATESAMLVRVLLYNIYNLFRCEIMPKLEQGKRLCTLRFKYFIIPAITGIRGNQTILRLGIKSKSLIGKIKFLFSAINQCISPVNF